MLILRYCFNSACFVIVFGMTVVWLCTYLRNEDSVRVDFKTFDFPKGQYPMLLFCLIDRFILSELKKYNKTLTVAKYKQYLREKSFSKEMMDVNFDDVTLNLTNFYIGSFAKFRNGSQWHRFYELPQLTYSGFRDGSRIFRCFGLKSKVTNVESILFRFNSSLYPGGTRPSYPFILVALHLPNQISLRGSLTKDTWPKRNQKKELEKGHKMKFTMQQLEVLKRRNKQNDPYVPDELNFDRIILDEHLEQIGCKAPYHRTDKSLELCDSREKMKETSDDLMGKEKPKKACTIASTLTFTYDESDNKHKVYFEVVLYYPYHLKEVVMVRAVDLQTVIGNAGGYIGLFLGTII